MNIRKKARETALQTLYKIDVAEGAGNEALQLEFEELPPGTEARRYCEKLVQGVADSRKDIDSIIEKYAENWTVERMAIVDRNILRIAVFEMKNSPDVPFKVVIDQAVELAKKYGSEESGSFINGVLDNIRKSEAYEKRA